MDNKTVILNKFERPTMRIEGRFFYGVTVRKSQLSLIKSSFYNLLCLFLSSLLFSCIVISYIYNVMSFCLLSILC